MKNRSSLFILLLYSCLIETFMNLSLQPIISLIVYSTLTENIFIFLSQKPEFIGRPRIIKENNDKTIVLELDCEGDKLADCQWFKDGAPIKNAGRYLIEFTETSPKLFCLVLEIDNIIPSDAGSYTCVAKNDAGDSERNVVLRPEDVVLPVTVISNETAPSFKEKPKDQVRDFF